MTPEELDAILDCYESTDEADAIREAFENGTMRYWLGKSKTG